MSAFTLTRHLPADATAHALRADVLAGLTADPKSLPPKWFYDARGSELFEEITRLPEYYPTRAERAILDRAAGAIATVTGADAWSNWAPAPRRRPGCSSTRCGPAAPEHVRPGRRQRERARTGRAGADRRTTRGSPSTRWSPTSRPASTCPGPTGPRLVAFLGGTIGNLLPAERAAFFAGVHGPLPPGDALLLGTDLVKDERTLVAAYDDAAGVTAAFNKNVLSVLNRELGADFDPDDFDHVALWDREHEWIEMRLRATRARSP